MPSSACFSIEHLSDPESRAFREELAQGFREAHAAQWQQVLFALRFDLHELLMPSIVRGGKPPAAAEPLAKQVLVCLRRAIQDGRLPGEETMPLWLTGTYLDVYGDIRRSLKDNERWMCELKAKPLDHMPDALSQEVLEIMQEVRRRREELEVGQHLPNADL